ncbi:DNA cytosine methyltransferase [Komarekiella sp. 'clone 1']|uniref:DNA cytosine methyltransferase n=1 Tax=Komarekiella delphini-convector SJRDD-AB1 TaxID=2593771 RepID=A0AA40VUX0_9NOST|nr:DNA cytosine methyltransferase [Komarekiella delphini-convector]MBD6620537.1 DNA cytosine methyltransferase [Komarekiella delphini-convector SJRDD-AB1]
MQLKHVSFFAGIAGFELGIEAAGVSDIIKTELFIENNPDAQAVLRYRYPNISIHSDIRDYYPQPGEFSLYTIGFPCTGTSGAGNGTGLSHPESALWFESLRCIADGRPSFAIIENPEGLIYRGLRAILGGLRVVGYHWDDPQLISAAEVGSPQQRNRLFVVAYTNNILQRLNGMQTSWGNQIGAEIKAIYNQGRQVKPSRTRVDDGVPHWLGGKSIDGWWRDNLSAAPVYPGIRHHLNKRRDCNDLYARSVCPLQAAIAIKRVCYLANFASCA